MLHKRSGKKRQFFNSLRKGHPFKNSGDGKMKRCKKCGVPLEGILYTMIAKAIFGVKPSEKEPDTCNKCEIKK